MIKKLFCILTVTLTIGYWYFFVFMRPLISVVMPVYNRADLVINTIHSVLTQTYKNFEFIIVDDGSTDKTPSVIKHFAKFDKRIKFIQHKKNLGVASARNTAQQAATGKYLYIMDSDDLLFPHSLETSVSYMLKHPGVDALIVGAIITPHPELYVKKQKRKKNIINNTKKTPFDFDLFFANAHINPGTLIRTDFIKENKIKYRPNLVIGEDYDFWMQMVFKKANFAYIKNKLICIRKHPNRSIYQRKNDKYIPDTLRIKKYYFNKIGLRDIPVQMYYNLKEKCDYVQSALRKNVRWSPYFKKSAENFLKNRCAIDIPNKILLSHPAWVDFVIMTDSTKCYRFQIGDSCTYKKSEDEIILTTSSEKKQKFIRQKDDIYYYTEPTEESENKYISY